MDIYRHNGTLSVRGGHILGAHNARLFRNEVCAAIAPDLNSIEIDLSHTASVDSGGLAALVAIYETAQARNRNGGVAVRLLHPQPPVQQMFELTRAHQLFEIILLNGKSSANPPAPESADGSHPPQ